MKRYYFEENSFRASLNGKLIGSKPSEWHFNGYYSGIAYDYDSDDYKLINTSGSFGIVFNEPLFDDENDEIGVVEFDFRHHLDKETSEIYNRFFKLED
jgi:hypothetical protein